jgi:hypothetical protein
MSIGKNPYVAKAEAAEQKALSARDHIAKEQAFRDAARQWERAADREKDNKRRELYVEKAEQARKQADEPSAPDADGKQPSAEKIARAKKSATDLN